MDYGNFNSTQNGYGNGNSGNNGYNTNNPDITYVKPPVQSGWIDVIGDFVVERKEIKRSGNKPYLNVGHTRVGVLHTTEGGTIDGAYTQLATSHDAPHFIAGEGRIIQCRPIYAQAASLEDAGMSNNASAALQIEMVGYSRLTLWTPSDSSLFPVLAILKWASLDPLNIPLSRPADAWVDDCSDCPLPWASTQNSRRLTPGIWPAQAGWYMHMEVPGNHHWDCGALRFREMLAMAGQ